MSSRSRSQATNPQKIFAKTSVDYFVRKHGMLVYGPSTECSLEGQGHSEAADLLTGSVCYQT